MIENEMAKLEKPDQVRLQLLLVARARRAAVRRRSVASDQPPLPPPCAVERPRGLSPGRRTLLVAVCSRAAFVELRHAGPLAPCDDERADAFRTIRGLRRRPATARTSDCRTPPRPARTSPCPTTRSRSRWGSPPSWIDAHSVQPYLDISAQSRAAPPWPDRADPSTTRPAGPEASSGSVGLAPDVAQLEARLVVARVLVVDQPEPSPSSMMFAASRSLLHGTFGSGATASAARMRSA